jgi:hypothetical protein
LDAAKDLLFVATRAAAVANYYCHAPSRDRWAIYLRGIDQISFCTSKFRQHPFGNNSQEIDVLSQAASAGVKYFVVMRALTLVAPFGIALAGCAGHDPVARLPLPTSDQVRVAASRVVDCEWKAANRYDDGTYTIAQVTERILGICILERDRYHRLFHLSSYDPEIELNDVKEATGIVESARKQRNGGN